MKQLSLGKTGPYVELLQSVLKKYGYYDGNIDGIFGNMTKRAVTEFQEQAGLYPDGIVGKRTWGVLTPLINGYFIHTVSSGDTFYDLAKRYSADLRLILSANPQKDPENLKIGEEVIIPIQGGIVPTDVSYSYPIMNININSLFVRFPFLIRENV